MKKPAIKIALVLLVCLMGSCSIFKPGCHCPKVSYNSYPKH